MKPIRWTKHAEEKLQYRDIDRDEVERTLEHPDAVVAVTSDPLRVVYQRRYSDEKIEAEMILRVVVEETPLELVVVTVYRSSRLGKYQGEQGK
jgi:hypothetical protein